jgi:Asparagine synthase
VAPVRLGPGGLPVLEPSDVLAGYPLGMGPDPGPAPRPDPDPVGALRSALVPAVARTPCVVAFSGGRDSSVLLAHAADLAARAGLPAPVALTLRYPGDPEADESAWQELVVAHLRRLGLPLEWECRDVTDELDLVGPLAAPILRRHGGPLFPPAIGNTVLLTAAAHGGALVTGNFGDEVLGDHRAAALRAVWRRRARRMTRADWRTVITAAAPGPARTRLLRDRAEPRPWLRQPLQDRVLGAEAADVAARPLRWDASVRMALRPRAVGIGSATRRRIGADHGCDLVEPLGAPAFVDSIAAHGGRWGRLSRGAAVRLLGGALVPGALPGRRQKAQFNRSRFGPASRALAERWTGTGVDPDLVDPVELRAAWLADVPPAAAAMLLQQAWLADTGP